MGEGAEDGEEHPPEASPETQKAQNDAAGARGRRSSSQDYLLAPIRLLRSMTGGFSFLTKGFRRKKLDFEQLLKDLTKEEQVIAKRMKRRAARWRWLARTLVLYSIVLEGLLLGFAVYSTRSKPRIWKERLPYVLPVFLLPAFSALLYSAFGRYYRMRERQDTQAKEDLKALRQQQIDEIKEKSNYYKMLELVQKYDTDPNAKAAAANALVHRIGAEAGLKAQVTPPQASQNRGGTPLKTPDRATSAQGGPLSTPQSAGGGHPSSGLRQRRTSNQPPFSAPATPHRQFPSEDWDPRPEEDLEGSDSEGEDTGGAKVEQRKGVLGVLERLAGMLVGEDPTQCYALICKRCKMHNGLVKKEDLEVLVYHCRYCNHLNGSKAAATSHLRRESDDATAAAAERQLEQPSSPMVNEGAELQRNAIEGDSVDGASRGNTVDKGRGKGPGFGSPVKR